jgi:asparagine synthase (glutamine-hydrolysing)
LERQIEGTYFAGAVAFSGQPLGLRRESALVDVFRRRGIAQRPSVRRSANGIFLHSQDSGAGGGNSLFAANCRIENLRDAAQECGVPPNLDDAVTVERIFETRGDWGIARLLGAFAFAHWDERTRTLALARDCLGHRCLFYHLGDGIASFASNLSLLLAMPDVPRQLDEVMLAQFMALNHREGETTVYQGICRVPSRTIVRITPKGIEQRQYWAPKLDAPPPFRKDSEYIEHARALFDRATKRALYGTTRVAAELSGGLDSSAVAATIARLGTVECVCYTGVPPPGLDRAPLAGRYLDERPKVEALARLHPSLKTVFVTPRGAHRRQSDPTRLYAELPLPHRNTCNLGWFGAIGDAMDADGHGVRIHGSRGNMTTSWAGTHSLAFLLSRGRTVSTLREARGISRASGRSLLHVLLAEAVRPLLPAPAHRLLDKVRGTSRNYIEAFTLLRPEVIEELNLRAKWVEDGYDPSHAVIGATSAQWRAHKIFDHNQIGRDTACMQAEAGGYEIRSPFDDRELIEFCLAVPETMFRRNGTRRWFARQVFADRLPPEILTETKIGEQAPNWFESLDARRPIADAEVQRIEASELASRLIDVPRLKRLLAEWPQNERAAQQRVNAYRYALDRAVHLSQFIRWVSGGNG